jgi:S1-C subfamily serine protease
VTKLKLRNFYPLFLFCLLFWAGCVPTFQYNGITYPDSYQALNAQKIDIQMAIDSITPRQNNLEGTAKFISPSYGTIRNYGVLSGPMTPEVSVNYIISGLHSSYTALFRALKKRNIFKSVTLEERDNTIDPELNDETYLIWLEVKSKDSWKWHIKSNRIKKSRIHIDTTQVEAGEIAKSWLNSLETILKTQSVNTKVATAPELPSSGLPLSKKEQDIEFYKRKILSDPSDYMAHVSLGTAYKDNDQTEKAIYEYEKAIIINPNDPLAYIGLGTLYFRLSAGHANSELNKGIYQYKKAIELDPQNPSFLYSLGTMYDLNNEGSNAIISTIKAQKLFLAKQDKKGIADCRRNLREYFKKYKYKPEDFESIEIETAPQSQQPAEATESVYSGTGFLFSAKDYVITNWHVVRGTNNIKVKFLNGEKIEAEVALKDPQNDIAFLKLARQPQLPPSNLKIGDSSNMKMGDKVFTIGYPAHFLMGDNPKYTEGVVNATSGLQDDPTVFQVSVEIQPGNSGGPLFNEKGEVIGITSSSLDPEAAVEAFGTLPQNVNYAIKSTYISALLPMLPQTLIASRGIVIVPAEPENTLANFIEKAKKNIVLIEATE